MRTWVKLSKVGWLAVLLLAGSLLLAPKAQAVIAYDIQSVQTGNQNYGGSLGMDFDVNSTISVTELGVFDSGGSGILGTTLYVTIFDRTGAHPTVTPTLSFTGTDGTLIGGSRFKALSSPVSLGPGQYSIVAWGYSSSEQNGNWNVNHAMPLSVENSGGGLISFVGTSRYGTAGAYPTSTLSTLPTNCFLAGTFSFVPLPASVLLLGSGLLGLGLLRFRKRA